MNHSELDTTTATNSAQLADTQENVNNLSPIQLFIADFSDPELRKRSKYLDSFCRDVMRIASLKPGIKQKAELLEIYLFVRAFTKIHDLDQPNDNLKGTIKFSESAISRLMGVALQAVPVIDIDSLLLEKKEERIERLMSLSERAIVIREKEIFHEIKMAEKPIRSHKNDFIALYNRLDAYSRYQEFITFWDRTLPIDLLASFEGVLEHCIKHIDILKVDQQIVNNLFAITGNFLSIMSQYNKNEINDGDDQELGEKTFMRAFKCAETLITLPYVTASVVTGMIYQGFNYNMVGYPDQLKKLEICGLLLNEARRFESVWTDSDRTNFEFYERWFKFSCLESRLGIYLKDLSTTLNKNSWVKEEDLKSLIAKFDEYVNFAFLYRPSCSGCNLDDRLLNQLSGFIKRLLTLTKQEMPADLEELTARFLEGLKGTEPDLESSMAYVQSLFIKISKGSIKGQPKQAFFQPSIQKRIKRVRQPQVSSMKPIEDARPVEVSKPESLELVQAESSQSSEPEVLIDNQEEIKTADSANQFNQFVTELYQRAHRLNQVFAQFQEVKDQPKTILDLCKTLEKVKATGAGLRTSTVSEEIAIAQMQAEKAAEQTHKAYQNLFFKQIPVSNTALENFNAEYQSFDNWIREQTKGEWSAPPIHWDQSVIVDSVKLSYFEYFYAEQMPCLTQDAIQRRAEKLINYLSHYSAPLAEEYITVITTLVIWANQSVSMPEFLLELLKKSAEGVIQRVVGTEDEENLLDLIVEEMSMGDSQAIYQKLEELNILKHLGEALDERRSTMTPAKF